ncbi:MAG: sulfite exporter TauE/SafE family protein [Clostridia bacterium]|nr:sulfite exporter TauE/SafE family protein [Clostridia bacterium]
MAEVLIGLVSGIVSGTGMGGGTILIFLLSFFMGIEQHIAQATNLIFFIPTSIVAIIVNLKNKNIDLKLAILISIFGIFGAIIGANISIHTDVKILKKCFGIFLAVITINEIYSIIKLYIKPYKKVKKINNK